MRRHCGTHCERLQKAVTRLGDRQFFVYDRECTCRTGCPPLLGDFHLKTSLPGSSFCISGERENALCVRPLHGPLHPCLAQAGGNTRPELTTIPRACICAAQALPGEPTHAGNGSPVPELPRTTAVACTGRCLGAAAGARPTAMAIGVHFSLPFF